MTAARWGVRSSSRTASTRVAASDSELDDDPELALWSGADGLDAIRALEARAAVLLRDGGVIGVEHADLQGESAPAVFSDSGRWSQVEDHRDLADRPRFLTARLAR